MQTLILTRLVRPCLSQHLTLLDDDFRRVLTVDGISAISYVVEHADRVTLPCSVSSAARGEVDVLVVNEEADVSHKELLGPTLLILVRDCVADRDDTWQGACIAVVFVRSTHVRNPPIAAGENRPLACRLDGRYPLLASMAGPANGKDNN